VIINTVVFIFFTSSFTKLLIGRDWRSFCAFSAFLSALFTDQKVRCESPHNVTLLVPVRSKSTKG